jgi:hypothetical protein
MSLIETLLICWLILLPNGDVFCHCEGEAMPNQIVQSIPVRKDPSPLVVNRSAGPTKQLRRRIER